MLQRFFDRIVCLNWKHKVKILTERLNTAEIQRDSYQHQLAQAMHENRQLAKEHYEVHAFNAKLIAENQERVRALGQQVVAARHARDVAVRDKEAFKQRMILLLDQIEQSKQIRLLEGEGGRTL